MYVFSLIFLSLLQGYHFAREDVIAQYEPLFAALVANYSAYQSAATTSAELLLDKAMTATDNTINQVDSQLKNLDSTIAKAKAVCANDINALNCLSSQESIANTLSSASINTTCFTAKILDYLYSVSRDLEIVSTICANGMEQCSSFYPAEEQDDMFEGCLIGRLSYFEERLQALVFQFEQTDALIGDLVNGSLVCLSELNASFGLQINQIVYQVSVCLTVFPCRALV